MDRSSRQVRPRGAPVASASFCEASYEILIVVNRRLRTQKAADGASTPASVGSTSTANIKCQDRPVRFVPKGDIAGLACYEEVAN
jgi:hypothetical protein